MESINKSDAVKGVTVNAEDHMVNRKLTTSRGDLTYQNDWTLDFSSCTPEQVLELASRSVTITLQGRFRRGTLEDAAGMQDMVVDVAEELKRESKATPTPERLAKSATKLTSEQRLALIAELEAMG